MLDYHGNCVALSEFVAALTAAGFPEPELTAARDEALAAVADEPGAALLGAFVQHLLVHAASDGWEVELLQRAADLWGRGLAVCDQLGRARSDLEAAMDDPAAPGAADRFNEAAVLAQEVANTVALMRLDIDAVRADAAAFAHLPAHPRQDDLGTEAWDWGTLLLARRTDAFVRTLFSTAADRRSTAFAVGAASAYGANVAGSAYLGHAVGGPRRTHRHRDRLARNTVGSWLAANHPGALSPGAMAAQVRFSPGPAPGLPLGLEPFIFDALAATFDTTSTLPIPDLQTGYRRLVEHLTLLDDFTAPAVPVSPGQLWMAALYGDPANPPPSLRPQDFDVVGQDDGGVAVQHGAGEPGSGQPSNSDSAKAAKGCGIGILAIILIDLLQAFVQCVGQWANGNPCTFWDNMLLSKLWEQDPPDPRDPTNPGVGQSELTAIAASRQAAQLVGILFDAHTQAWEAMDRARAFLAVTGLIYPTDLTTLPLYAQFTSLPGETSWPHREEADPPSAYHRYPTSELERPHQTPSPFPGEAGPHVFLTPGERLDATTVALGLWRQIAAGVQDSQNLDLDADRGFGHACWAADGSVHDDPIAVVVLPYEAQ
ncbi:MAG: hypothetical protein ACRD1D_08595 [Acidimicrobiales bacterium]